MQHNKALMAFNLINSPFPWALRISPTADGAVCVAVTAEAAIMTSEVDSGAVVRGSTDTGPCQEISLWSHLRNLEAWASKVRRRGRRLCVSRTPCVAEVALLAALIEDQTLRQPPNLPPPLTEPKLPPQVQIPDDHRPQQQLVHDHVLARAPDPLLTHEQLPTHTLGRVLGHG